MQEAKLEILGCTYTGYCIFPDQDKEDVPREFMSDGPALDGPGCIAISAKECINTLFTENVAASYEKSRPKPAPVYPA